MTTAPRGGALRGLCRPRSAPLSSRVLVPLASFLALAASCAAGTSAAALTILRDFQGGTPPANSVGSGNLVSLFNAAADAWERVILTPHTLTLHYSWAPIGGADHILVAQSGTPNRETEGSIRFNNDNVETHFMWFLDPTPTMNEEYSHYTEYTHDMGTGLMNVGRLYSDLAGDPPWRYTHQDLLSAAMHEIGHALGMSIGNLSFTAESADTFINIRLPRPWAGSRVRLAVILSGVTSHFDYDATGYGPLMEGTNANERRYPSALDIVADAELSGFDALRGVTEVGEPAVPDVVARNLLLGGRPNPFVTETAIDYQLAVPGQVSVELIDLQGRRVRMLGSGQQAAGPHSMRWAGESDRGEKVRSGIYWCRITFPDGSAQTRRLSRLE